MTLLHFIVRTVREKFPDVANFDTELKYVEKAATGIHRFSLDLLTYDSKPIFGPFRSQMGQHQEQKRLITHSFEVILISLFFVFCETLCMRYSTASSVMSLSCFIGVC